MLNRPIGKGGPQRRAARLAVALAACAISLPGVAQQTAVPQATPSPVARAEVGPVESFFQDSLVTARVRFALLDAPGVSSMDIGVRTHRGVVQLSGFVNDEQLVSRAGEIAARVPGVTGVRNALQVKG